MKKLGIIEEDIAIQMEEYSLPAIPALAMHGQDK